MKPLLSEFEDNRSLQLLGRASIQIVHDLKNQLNGLKLYATFLRKRIEKGERPADELETITKLLAGIDRTAESLSLLSQYGEPILLKQKEASDIEQIMRGVVAQLNEAGAQNPQGAAIIIEAEPGVLISQGDNASLTQALKSISTSAANLYKRGQKDDPLRIQLSSDTSGERRDGIIDWHVLDSVDHDPFLSFAGSDEIRMALAAKVVEAHGGSAERRNGFLRVRLPLIK